MLIIFPEFAAVRDFRLRTPILEYKDEINILRILSPYLKDSIQKLQKRIELTKTDVINTKQNKISLDFGGSLF